MILYCQVLKDRHSSQVVKVIDLPIDYEGICDTIIADPMVVQMLSEDYNSSGWGVGSVDCFIILTHANYPSLEYKFSVYRHHPTDVEDHDPHCMEIDDIHYSFGLDYQEIRLKHLIELYKAGWLKDDN